MEGCSPVHPESLNHLWRSFRLAASRHPTANEIYRKMCADAATSECSFCGFEHRLFSFERWKRIMFPWLDWDWWKVPRSLPSPFSVFYGHMCERHFGQVCVEARPAGEQFCYPEISRETKKKPKKAPTTAEREPRIKTTKLLAAGKKKTQKKKQQNKPRNIWILCRNHNLYIPSTIMYN